MRAAKQTAVQKEWQDAIDAKASAGKSGAQAVIEVSRERPELRQRLVAEANKAE